MAKKLSNLLRHRMATKMLAIQYAVDDEMRKKVNNVLLFQLEDTMNDKMSNQIEIVLLGHIDEKMCIQIDAEYYLKLMKVF